MRRKGDDMSKNAKYELGVITEFGDGEAVIHAAGKEYLVQLDQEEENHLESLLLDEEEGLEYVAFDIQNKNIVFEDVFHMGAEDTEELTDIDVGVQENGIAE